MAIVDASVTSSAVIRKDVNHRTAVSWFARALHAQERLSAPALMLAELGSAVARATGSRREADLAVTAYMGPGLVRCMPDSLVLCARAGRIAAEYGIKGCDAVYVALAEQLGEPLVTFDQEQLNRASALITVIRPA